MKLLRLLALALVISAVGASCAPFGGDDTDTAPVVAYFRDVGDLVEDGQVQVNDVEVGRITAIELVLRDGEMLAKVTMSVGEKHNVPAEDMEAIVRQTSLLGEQFVQLVPTSEGRPFAGEAPVTVPVEATDRRVDVETLLADLAGFVAGGGLEDLNRFTHAQALILQNRGQRFGQTIEELETFTGVLAGRKDDLAASIDHLASASKTLADNRDTLDDFLDSLESGNDLLADQAVEFGRLFRALQRFGSVNARFLARHEGAIDRNFKALRPILRGLAEAQGELRTDITQLATFFELFPKSFGGGPGGEGQGDYIQVDAILCENLANCHSKGEKGDVPGEGS